MQHWFDCLYAESSVKVSAAAIIWGLLGIPLFKAYVWKFFYSRGNVKFSICLAFNIQP